MLPKSRVNKIERKFHQKGSVFFRDNHTASSYLRIVLITYILQFFVNFGNLEF